MVIILIIASGFDIIPNIISIINLVAMIIIINIINSITTGYYS